MNARVARAETREQVARCFEVMRELRPLQRQVLGLFVQSKVVTVGELADYLGIAARQGRDLCSKTM